MTNETAKGFEVREMKGGQSSVAFDYRIVAKRKGYENIRLADKSEMVNRIRNHHADKSATAKLPSAEMEFRPYPNQGRPRHQAAFGFDQGS